MISLSEEKIAEIKERLAKLTKTSVRPKNIKSITVNPSNHALPKMKIEVGKYCKTLDVGASPELVIAIFESTLFMVITETHGLNDGMPYFFFRGDVRLVEEFE